MEKYCLAIIKKSDYIDLSFTDALKAAILISECMANTDADAAKWFKAQLRTSPCGLTDSLREKTLCALDYGITALCHPYRYYIVLA